MVIENYICFNFQDNFAKIKNTPSICIKRSRIEFPKFSIIVPTYKRSSLLEQAIDSALNQSVDFKYEIIVVDNDPGRNCTTENLILKKYSDEPALAYYKNAENLGMFGNWNRGVELSRANWIGMLHDDDMLLPNYLEELNHFLANIDDEVALVGNIPLKLYEANIEQGAENKLYACLRPLASSFLRNLGCLLRGRVCQVSWFDLFFSVPIRPAGIMFKKEAVLNRGGFGDKVYAEDYVFFVKLFLVHSKSLRVLNKPISVYRVGVNESLNLSTKEQFVKSNYIIRKHLLAKSLLSTSLTRFFSWFLRVDYNIGLKTIGSKEAKKQTYLGGCLVKLFRFVISLFQPYLYPKKLGK